MKTSPLAALAAVLIATGTLSPRVLFAQSTDPEIPVGSLTAFPVVVQPGTRPTLTWNISYPSIVKDYITIEDPSNFTAPFTGQLAFNATNEKIYDYACHEGNYALPGILAGARKAESEGRKPESVDLAE